MFALFPNYNSPVYEDFGVWRINQIINYYYDYPPHGIFWDNVITNLAFVVDIENTIEYQGQGHDWEEAHQRDIDYHAFYNRVKDRVDPGGSLLWQGNVNSMWFMRANDNP